MENNPSSSEAKPPYEFWAFISYSRKDKVVAKRLHEFIETYGVPVEFVEHPIAAIGEAAPVRLHPCFRDIDDLPSGPSLPKALREKLAASRFLVVVCSPNSAASEWVDKEIIEFRALHGEGAEGRIHSFIIAGRPNRNATDCCFPPSLRDQNPCAPNATPLGEGDRIARLKLIAAMIGVSPDAIIRRDQERRMKRMKLAVAAAFLLVSVLSWFWWRASVARDAEEAAKERAIHAEAKTIEQLKETQRQLERSWLEEGRAWLERGKAALNRGDNLSALLLAGRALGFRSYGSQATETKAFSDAYPPLLSEDMQDTTAEKERVEEATQTAKFIESIALTFLPQWASRMKNNVLCVAFSPDGSRLASGSGDATIKLWDTATGKELALIQRHERSVTSIAFSPDGTRFASSTNDKTIKTWDAVTGKELARLQGHTHPVTSVAFSPNGTLLASSSNDNTIKFWNTATGKELASLQGHTDPVSSVAFSPDGTRLASSSNDKTIKLWNTATGKELASLQGHTAPVSSVAFSPDGFLLASGSLDETIRLWDLTGKLLAILKGHTHDVDSVAFSPDGVRLASGSRDNTIRLWDAATGKELASLPGHTDPVSSVAFSPDGKSLASSSYDETVKLWLAASGKEQLNLQEHSERVSSVAFSPDGILLASGSFDHTIKLWDTHTGKELASLQGHPSYVTCVAFSPNGNLLASGSGDKTIKLWDIATGKELTRLQGHTSYVTSVAFSPDGRYLASGAFGRTIKLWDTVTGKELSDPTPGDIGVAIQWLVVQKHRQHPEGQLIAELNGNNILIMVGEATLDLAVPLRSGLAAFQGREVVFPNVTGTTPMIHYHQDTLAQLADPNLTPDRRAELRMELCTKSSQFRAATALWQRLLQGEWPGFEGATVQKDQAPATIPADSPIRRLYLLTLIDATKHPQIHGHPTICQTAAQIAPVLTKEMMATPTISLAMMSLMQTLAKDESADMRGPRETLVKRLAEVATKEWLRVLKE